MLTWFDNPPRRRGKPKRRKSKKLYGAAAKAHARAQRRKGGRKMARRKSRKKLYGAAAAAHARARRRGGSKRRSSSRRRRSTAGRRSWRRTSATVARRAGRQLRYRRTNPPRLRGIVGQLQQGAIDAGFIVAGKAASRIIAGFVPVVGGGQAVQIAVQAAAALAAGYVGRYISPNASRMMLAGGLAGVVESFVKGLNIPYVSAALGDDYYTPGPLAVGGYPQQNQVGAYPGISAYPALMAGSDDEDDVYAQ